MTHCGLVESDLPKFKKGSRLIFQIDSIHIWCHIMVYNLEEDYEYDSID